MSGDAPIEVRAMERTEEEMLRSKLEHTRRNLNELYGYVDKFVESLPPIKVIEGKEEDWKRIIESNQDDPYGSAAVKVMERAARVLQVVGPGDRKQQAFNAICMVDRYGLTGFQVMCIESLLRKVWVYGTEFFPIKEDEE